MFSANLGSGVETQSCKLQYSEYSSFHAMRLSSWGTSEAVWCVCSEGINGEVAVYEHIEYTSSLCFLF
eukprot:scaffold17685_cov169-Amphora_coffeaeformis.AAC.10